MTRVINVTLAYVKNATNIQEIANVDAQIRRAICLLIAEVARKVFTAKIDAYVTFAVMIGVRIF